MPDTPTSTFKAFGLGFFVSPDSPPRSSIELSRPKPKRCKRHRLEGADWCSRAAATPAVASGPED